MKKTDQPIIVEQILNAPIAGVWKAITEPEQMKQWFFDTIETFKPEIGFQTNFIVENEGRIFPHLWKVIEVVIMKKISYNWRYEGYQGDSFVVFELFDKDHQTQLILTHNVVENFPIDVPEFSRGSCTQGWNYFIKQNLKKYLEKPK